MSETNEPSYYEIALTNRQVLFSFVILLSCVLAAFVSGVWVGRNGSGPVASEGEQVAAADASPGDLEKYEEFKFFSDREEAEAQAGGDLQEVATEPRQGTTLAEDVTNAGSSRNSTPTTEPQQQVRKPPPSPPPTQAAPRQTTPRQTSPPPAPSQTVRPAPTQVSQNEGLVIQVLSTRDEARAKRILNQLKQGGYPAFLSPVEVGTQINYRVRVGPYKERPPAVKAASEVNSKFKLDTWITAAGN